MCVGGVKTGFLSDETTVQFYRKIFESRIILIIITRVSEDLKTTYIKPDCL